MSSALASVPENSTSNSNSTSTSTSTSSASTSQSQLPPAAKSASENAVRSAMASEGVQSGSPENGKGEGDEEDEEGSGGEGGDPDEWRKRGSDGEFVTIFDDKNNFNVKHPLYSTWTLWFDNASKQDKAKDWSEQLQRVMDLESVEEFWGLYNNIVPPSHISPNSNFYLFRHGIKPAWEDAANSKGGKWSVQLPRDKSRDDIDRWWLYTMLAAIGETFETPYGLSINPTSQPQTPAEVSSLSTFTDEVTGVIVSSRKMFYRISIWTRTSDARAKVESIGRHLKAILDESGKKIGAKAGQAGGGIASDVEFVSHRDSQKKGNKNVWTI